MDFEKLKGLFRGPLEVEASISPLGPDIFLSYSRCNGIDGSGVSFNSSLAVRKSFFELLERIAFSKSDCSTSNGFAAHEELAAAAEHSRKELMERHLFLLGWFQKAPPCWLSTEQVCSISEKCAVGVENLKKKRLEIMFGIVGKISEHFVVCSVLKGNEYPTKFGVVFSLAIDKNLDKAMESALLDHYRTFEYIRGMFKNEHFALLPSFCEKGRIACAIDHKLFFLNPDNERYWSWYLDSKSQAEVQVFPEIEITTRQIETIIPYEGPHYVCHSTAEHSVPLFWGAILKERMPARILSDLTLDELNEIHPLG